MFHIRKPLSTPTEQLGKASRFIVFQIKLWSHCARVLKANRSGQQAAALSYHTIFGIIPVAIVMLLIFQSFPAYKHIGEKIKAAIYKQANLTAYSTVVQQEEDGETVALTEKLDRVINRFFTGTHTGSITFLSVVAVIWAALALLSTIEKSFNNIWHVSKPRNLLNRVINYWAVLTLGPLLIGAGIYLGTTFSPLSKLQQTIISIGAPIVFSYIIATVTFFLLYFILPNTRVNVKAALGGAALSALIWIAAKYLFSYSVTEFGLYKSIYGTLGLIPITVVWIFITWLIILFGLQLTYTTQNLSSLDAESIGHTRQSEGLFIANDMTVINILREITAAFEQNKAPVEPQRVSSRLGIPLEFSEKILHHLVKAGILAKTSEPKDGFLPTRDPESIKLSEVTEAVARAGFAQNVPETSQQLEQIRQSYNANLAQYNIKQILQPPPKNEQAAQS